MAEAVIEVRNLRKSFGANPVLLDINFSAEKGEVVCIIGASGSGKSTLLRCVNLLETPGGGAVYYRGQNIQTEIKSIAQYHAKVGMVFQQFNLFNNLSVLNNCVIGLDLRLYIFTAVIHRAPARRFQQIDAAQQRALARAGRADNAHHFALFRAEVDVQQDGIGPEALPEVPDLYDRLSHGPPLFRIIIAACG